MDATKIKVLEIMFIAYLKDDPVQQQRAEREIEKIMFTNCDLDVLTNAFAQMIAKAKVYVNGAQHA